MNKSRMAAIAVAVVLVAMVSVTVWWVRNRAVAEGESRAGAATAPAVTAEQVEPIVGRWRRTDGGYVVDILGLDAAAGLKVAYYNPRPINVSQAQVVHGSTGLHVFIELRDTGYPGATYRLDYDATTDTMTGFYHQPTADQTFDVVFVRAQ